MTFDTKTLGSIAIIFLCSLIAVSSTLYCVVDDCRTFEQVKIFNTLYECYKADGN